MVWDVGKRGQFKHAHRKRGRKDKMAVAGTVTMEEWVGERELLVGGWVVPVKETDTNTPTHTHA